MRSTCTSRRSSSAPASASTTTRLTTGSSGFTGSATAIPLRLSTCGTDPSLPVGSQPALRARPRPPTARGSCAEAVAEGVLIRESVFCRATLLSCAAGLACCSSSSGCRLRNRRPRRRPSRPGQPVVAGFSTHPHWDHLLWHARLGATPRYATARCAALSEFCCRTRVGRPASSSGYRRTSPTRYRWTCSASFRSARRDGADSLGRPSGPDYRASSACPGPCGAAD